MPQRMAQKGSESKDNETQAMTFVLMEDKVGKVMPKNVFERGVSRMTRRMTSDTSEFTAFQAIKGSLFQELPRDKQPEDKQIVALISLENSQHILETSLKDVREISKEVKDILLAVPSKLDRYEIMNNRDKLRQALAAKEGDQVTVETDRGEPMGMIKYIGFIHKQKGVHFGVVFKNAVGDSNGAVDGIAHFTCKKDHGMFVPLHKINFLQTTKDDSTQKASNTKKNTFLTGKENNSSKKSAKRKSDGLNVDAVHNLTVGTRVIAFPEKAKGQPKRGVIRFLGHPDKFEKNTVIAGVELDEKYGAKFGANYARVKKLFECADGKGIVVNPETLLREDQFDEKAGDFKEPYDIVTTNEAQEVDEEPKQLRREEVVPPEIKVVDPVAEQEEILKKFNEKKQNGNLVRSTSISKEPDISMHSNVSSKPGNDMNLENRSTAESTQTPTENDSDENDSARIKSGLSYHNKEIDVLKTEIGVQSSNVPKPDSSFYKTLHTRNEYSTPATTKNNKMASVGSSEVNDDLMIHRLNDHSEMHNYANQKSGHKSLDYYNQTYDSRLKHIKTPKQLNTATYSSVLKQDENSSRKAEFVIDHEMNPDHISDDDMYGCQIAENHVLPENHDIEVQQKAPAYSPAHDTFLQVGSMAEIRIRNNSYFGVIRWEEIVPEISPDDILAGLELEDIIQGGTDGTLKGQRYFTCPSGRAFFIKLRHCMPDSRFNNLSLNSDSYKEQIESVKGSILPPKKLSLDYIGRDKGVQGHHNSCYMDATLFAMFAFSYVFDAALHRIKRRDDRDNYDHVQRILREQIVNPLRQNGFVHHKSVMELRKCLNELVKIGGFLNEEKDPEEFVVLLFEKVLKVDPFVRLRSENGREEVSHLYQIFAEKDERNPMPSIQYLLEYSFLTANLQLVETPSVMILQMPRFGQQKLYGRIQVNPELDITSILSNVVHSCVICGESASNYCRECACQFGWDKVYMYLCQICWQSTHKHPKRQHHQRPSKVLERDYPSVYEQERVMMELFAVVCIKTSHYVSFVKCGSGDDESWVFFDSMADRHGGETGYNIPEVSRLDDLKTYLHAKPLKIAELDKKSDERILRIYEDASLCFYRNNKVTMYK